MRSHIDHHFDEALDGLKKQVLLMGSKVVEMVDDCVTALRNNDTGLTEPIIEADRAVDALEIAIDEQCLQLLARYQPAASDLRFITRGLKIVTDLERIGDLAVNFAQRVDDIVENGGFAEFDISGMTQYIQKMLKTSLDAFVAGDTKKAEEVLKSEETADEMTRKFVNELMEMSIAKTKGVKICFPMISIVRYLERIADHSTNIAEITIFMAKGRDIRHYHGRKKKLVV